MIWPDGYASRSFYPQFNWFCLYVGMHCCLAVSVTHGRGGMLGLKSHGAIVCRSCAVSRVPISAETLVHAPSVGEGGRHAAIGRGCRVMAEQSDVPHTFSSFRPCMCCWRAIVCPIKNVLTRTWYGWQMTSDAQHVAFPAAVAALLCRVPGPAVA